MKLIPVLAGALLLFSAHPAIAANEGVQASARKASREQAPQQLSSSERELYRAVFTDIRAGRWPEAAARLDAAKDGLLTPIARAELYLAKGSPKTELDPLMALLSEAPDMPKAAQIGRLATTRGATALPDIPQSQRFVWLGGKPLRARAAATRGDPVSDALGARVLPLIKENDPVTAETLLSEVEGQLTPQALTEWQQRIAWSHYIVGNDQAARMLAAKAQRGIGEWAAQADWVVGLASWRAQDFKAAAAAFQAVASRGQDSEFRAAGQFWAARAFMASGEPEKVQPLLRSAARNDETFYGLLAAQTLGMNDNAPDPLSADWKRISKLGNVRAAIALGEIGEYKLADETLRHQARIGTRADHAALCDLAARLNLPETQIWLAHNGPSGAQPTASARYPAPDWTPDGGWRVDKSLVFAHALQESNFRRDVVSPAGAYGLMQVMPAAARHMARDRGGDFSREALTNPSTNIEFGQRYLEYLRDFDGTQGLLPKVIAAYNAGPAPVRDWNYRNIDRGDPLLYIESLPYWETRGYVAIVLRNYWMYQRNAGEKSASLAAMAQGMWPRFPGLRGVTAVRMDAANRTQSAD
ncbi:lytic transglycosylase domain-containing protein [Sphingomonas sp. LaA6.9]|uniref:lytic transglycosylase domain-containing protein n=1 Tax=Sphingomonas sp. LaA6.9 TaxID=2919914 RepID=UPI001F4F79FA|nr:lytic transglycosylase domain-containing protein [Sphingomonas sp. LaA6.9]MCJ8157489.1 lytic transglycosylase domain-containing protein [Sphingomonas sp. LaA6.9]